METSNLDPLAAPETTLSYSITDPFLRSPVEEWQPHRKQSEITEEWWYLTTVLYDAAGNRYFLVWAPTHLTGEKTGGRASAGLPPDQRFVSAGASLMDYRDNVFINENPAGVVNEADTWDPTTNALRFAAGDFTSEWSFQGDSMHLRVASPKLSCDLSLTGASQVMYAKDSLGIEGFIQQGAEENRSYYYSLPRLGIVGRVSYTGKGGVQREIDVTGQGWVDRQWGDFPVEHWEWSSLRFNNGARVNLYNFASGHQAATYQKADGSTQWLDSFLIRQNGYIKSPEQGVWLSWGWSYEFPVEVEDSRRYTLEPISKREVFENPFTVVCEVPSHVINDETGETVGLAVTESADARIMQNAPYGPNQH
jgi:predicted secreted hydrolase